MRPSTVALALLVAGASGCTLIWGNDLNKKSDGSGGNGGGNGNNGITLPTQIGAGGGTVRSSDGKVTLLVPPGALSATKGFTITPTTNPFGGAGLIPLGPAYDIEPSGTMFAVPAKITFAMALLPPSPSTSLSVMSRSAGIDEALLTAVDPTAKTVVGYTTHLSTFGTVARPTTQAACYCNAGDCFTSCCDGTTTIMGDTCICQPNEPASYTPGPIVDASWKRWDCYNGCAGVTGLDKTTQCTDCVANCFRNIGAMITRAAPDGCTGVLYGGGDITACAQNCHKLGLDTPTTICSGGTLPGGGSDGGVTIPDGGTVPGGGTSRCPGTPHCTITLSGAVNLTYNCDVKQVGVFDNTAKNSTLESTWMVSHNTTMSDPKFVSANFFMSPMTPTPGTYQYPGATVDGAGAYVDQGSYDQYGQWVPGNTSNMTSGTLTLTCALPVSGPVSNQYSAAGTMMATLSGALGDITMTVDFVF